MRHSTTLIVAVVVVFAVLIGVAVWLMTGHGEPAESQEIRSVPHQYDTTSGQEMRTRWKQPRGGRP